MSLIESFENVKFPDEPFAIKKIISYGTGYVIVRCNNGNNYKRKGGTISWRYNNCGNLKYGDFAKSYGAVGPGWGGHSVFPTQLYGRNAQKGLLFTGVRGYNKLSILDAMKKYAPADDTGKGVPEGGNNPRNYAGVIANACGATINTVLKDLNEEQRDKMIEAMKKYEGYSVGTIIEV